MTKRTSNIVTTAVLAALAVVIGAVGVAVYNAQPERAEKRWVQVLPEYRDGPEDTRPYDPAVEQADRNRAAMERQRRSSGSATDGSRAYQRCDENRRQGGSLVACGADYIANADDEVVARAEFSGWEQHGSGFRKCSQQTGQCSYATRADFGG